MLAALRLRTARNEICGWRASGHRATPAFAFCDYIRLDFKSTLLGAHSMSMRVASVVFALCTLRSAALLTSPAQTTLTLRDAIVSKPILCSRGTDISRTSVVLMSSSPRKVLSRIKSRLLRRREKEEADQEAEDKRPSNDHNLRIAFNSSSETLSASCVPAKPVAQIQQSVSSLDPQSDTLSGVITPTASLQSLDAIENEGDEVTQIKTDYVPLTLKSMQDSQDALKALGLLASYLALGVLYYWQTTDWSLLQSVYFVIVTVTSIGYGDLTPSGDFSRLFTSAYILFGVAIIGNTLGVVAASMLSVDYTPAARILRWLSGQGDALYESEDVNKERDDSLEVNQLLGGSDIQGTLVSTLTTVVGCIVLGTLAFLVLEPGTTLIDALYYSVVTVTTVGYGDYTPSSEAGQLFLCAYALFGTVLLARSLGAIAALPIERNRQYQQQLVLTQYGDELDAEELVDLQTQLVNLELCDPEKGYCSRSDFALAMLVRQDKVSEVELKQLLKTFGELDIDGSGELDAEDVTAWVARASQ